MNKYSYIIVFLLLFQICLYAQECEIGYVELTNQTEISAFAETYGDCPRLLGSLEIRGEAVTDIAALGFIESISNTLYIVNTSLDSLSTFGQLVSVPQVYIESNSVLQQIYDFNRVGDNSSFRIKDNPSLRYANVLNEQRYSTGSGTFNVFRNESLDSLTVYTQLRKKEGDFIVWLNAELKHINDFEYLEEVGDKLRIGGCVIEKLPKFSQLHKVGGTLSLVQLRNKNFEGFNRLKEVRRLALEDLNRLEDYSGFDSLEVVIDDMDLNGTSYSAKVFNGFPALRSVGEELIIESNAIELLNGFEKLDSVGELFLTNGNQRLKTIDAFHNLVYIRDSLLLRGNPILDDISGFDQLKYVPRIHLAGNKSLTNLDFLSAIDTSVLNRLTIIDNDSLAICSSPPICAYLSDPNHYAEISGNAVGCATRSEIESSCYERIPRWLGRSAAEWQYCVTADGSAYEVGYSVVDTFEDRGLKYSVLGGGILPMFDRDTTWRIASDIDRVYYQEGDSLHLLYDFGVSVGDTVRLRVPVEMYADYYASHPDAPRHFEIVIRHVADVDLGDAVFRRVFFSRIDAELPLDLGGYYTEGMGYAHYLMPYLVSAVEGIGASRLQTYTDTDVDINYSSNIECEPTSTTVGIASSGIEEVRVYPNPVSSVVHIATVQRYETVHLYNILGSEVHSQSYTANIDVSSLPRGVYLLVLRGDIGEYTTRLVVE